ncbi:MAG TPA: hypothetical protein VGR55_05785 [Candidatus Acidoferrum sp.]|nr:hypothetical protein [Candidatus Acidoferrum sp.]
MASSSSVSQVSHWLALSITSQSTSRCLRLPAVAGLLAPARARPAVGLPALVGLPLVDVVPHTTLPFSNLLLVFRIIASSPAD